MRAVALALVLLNLGLFAWWRWVHDPQQDVTPPRTLRPQVERMALVLAEGEEETYRVGRGPAVRGAPGGNSEPGETERTEAQRPEAQRTEAARTEAARTEAERTEAERTEAEGAEADGAEAERTEAARRAADAGGAGASSPPPVSAPTPPRSPAAPSRAAPEPIVFAGTQLVVIVPSGVPAQCASVGPFPELPAAAEFAAALRARGLTPSQRLQQSDVWVGYNVMLEPAPSRAAALAVADRLRADGIEDLYVLPSGDLRNAVSLGLFSQRSRASRRVDQIRDLGYAAVIRDRTRRAAAYWVDFRVAPGERVDLSDYERPGRRLTNGDCRQ